ncbi:MAG: hypothetical protein ACE5IY_12380 [bacterium]
MENGDSKGFKPGPGRMGIVGFHELKNIDEVMSLYAELGDSARVPRRLIIDVLSQELSSKELKTFLKGISMKPPETISIKGIHSLLRAIPPRLYFFLWSLRNSDNIPVNGVLTSLELRKALLALNRFLNVLEGFLRKSPNSIPLFENLGFTYFDLAGVACYSRKGIYLNGRQFEYTTLLRKAIACFQCAIKLAAQLARELDATHLNILKLVDEKCDIDQGRTNLYLDPWHFLYISSALNLLNDEKMAEQYLNKTRSILNAIDMHQNPRIVAQKELLESIHTTLHFGKTVKFDFGQANLLKLQKKLKQVHKNRKRPHKRVGYSPMVEDALLQEFQVQRELRRSGVLQSEQKIYLNGVYTLYKQEISPLERDKLIYRLNIPPIKIRGLHSSSKPIQQPGVLPQESHRKPLKLAGKKYKAAS